ncbi:HD domain-containing phosphohydrolase [Thaumasiovibrio subtropicus]|uniref:HD domain-containing phosphohydrolase n=1 Tax=Thaumasiovibrio subtropicus TaxID=1891207 RepID=UPI00131E0481|nr:HD domain-containing phosphohydrolase [Thaumasiovibrio subtropicus]
MGKAFAETSVKNILILHSYHPSYQWTHDLQKGIEAALEESSVHVKLSIEYLDSKRVFSEEYYQTFEQYFIRKYIGYDFDGIILTDDNALLMGKRLSYLFDADTPTVAVGINDTRANLDDISVNNRVFYSKDRVLENLNLIADLRPQIKKLYFLTDQSISAQFVEKEVVAIFKESRMANIELVLVDNLTVQAASEFVANISPHDAVLMSHFNTEVESGVYYTYHEITKLIGEHSVAPVFVFWEFYIENGVLGGYVNHSEKLGRIAVYALSRFISFGVDMPSSYRSSYKPVFDFHSLERHGVSLASLPTSAILLNNPISFWEEHWQVLVIATVIIVCLLLIILAQGALIKHRKLLAQNNRQIYQLQSQMLGAQKEMVMMLGEAIESRSGETGNHVKRVAKMSAHLGQLYGLNSREIAELEAISPMHDVGKISIPDMILEKPGKLDAEEWAIMQTHTTLGYRLLSSSQGELFQKAAIIAHEHHERWDGEGYPNNKAGEAIHVYARITTIADVFDALLSKRCYKASWDVQEVIRYFQEGAGKQFDPTLTSMLLANIDAFLAIRNLYPD